MKFKRIIIIVLVLAIFTIGAVSASDLNKTDVDIAGTDNENLEISDGDAIAISDASEDIQSTTRTVTGHTFTDIQNTIDIANSGDTIQLSGTYTGSGKALSINKPLTIKGSGTTVLNAKGLSMIADNYWEYTDDIVFRDITFSNGAGSEGGALAYATAIDCSFKDCSAGNGGALAYGTATRCTFTNCHADNNGGALYSASAFNCVFSKCSAKRGGGAYGSSVWTNNGNSYGDRYLNCNFDQCSASGSGGGLYGGDEIKNCEFTKCSAQYGGGVTSGDASYCTFIGCTAESAGAFGDGTAYNCKFKGNSKPQISSYTYVTGKTDVNIKLTQSGSYYGDKKVTVTATDDFSGEAVENLDVIIKFSNGKSTTVTTNSNGKATYKVPFNPGTYTATAKAKNIDEGRITLTVNSNSNDLTVKISKRPAYLSPNRLVTAYGSGAYFQAKLSDSNTGKAISGTKLLFRIYTGSSCKSVTVTTNSNGIAKYRDPALVAGNHKVIVSLKDTSKYSASAKTSLIKVNKANLNVAAPKKISVFKKSNTYTITVKSKATGKVMKGVKVIVRVYNNGKYLNYNAVTNAAGQASINTIALSQGTHAVSIVIRAGQNYNAASARSSIGIITSKIKTSLTLMGPGGVQYAYHYNDEGLNDGVIIYPRLKDSYGGLLNKRVIVTTSGGDKISGYSGNGIFLGNSYDHDFVPIHGGYAIARFAGDGCYYASQFRINF